MGQAINPNIFLRLNENQIPEETYNINRFLLVRQIREMYWNSNLRFKKSLSSKVNS